MASDPPLLFHEFKHQHSERAERRAYRRTHLPPIPDLRFEPSYLRSIQPYIHLRTSKPSHKASETKVADLTERLVQNRSTEEKERDLIEVKWKHVLWITARDQILTPLFQGALWALIGFYVTPYSTRFAHAIVQHLPYRNRS
ncbi:hypothetical protein J3R30DRAFT_3694518 [Lentinula aciculospora]|uniref:Uncharacterized protein n=1 Tax=Lentinula aciculospora TaxID=153920 RepID=A0A9W9AVJ0_9AGAR|nr:hypothetical protein J3R30DRAFT_3694518 [Lentinula aciculospora]